MSAGRRLSLRRLGDRLRRSGHLATSLAAAALARPAAPVKVNLALTYWCQYRCRTCNIWRKKPTDELTTDELLTFVRENPGVTWADLTGGEIFLRPDIDMILEAVVAGWPRLALLHFPTNGFLTDRIVAAVERIAGRGPGRLIVTVSVDGDEPLNDEVRGVKGGFRRQMATFRALRRLPDVTAVLGVTLSGFNVGRLEETYRACAAHCPGLTMDDVHLNVAQRSSHYYDNVDVPAVEPGTAAIRREVQVYRQAKRTHWTPQHWLEGAYLRHLETFLETGRTPMPCHALRASCFIDPWGTVFPCITYARPVGRLRETGMRLEPLWNAPTTSALQQEIWRGECPQCWTACEAYQSILANGLVGRRVTRATGPSLRDRGLSPGHEP